MKRYSKVGQTICKAGTDSDLCAAICGPVPEFLCCKHSMLLLAMRVFNDAVKRVINVNYMCFMNHS
jgi:hypothetical protein